MATSLGLHLLKRVSPFWSNACRIFKALETTRFPLFYDKYSRLSSVRRAAMANQFVAESNWAEVLKITAKIPSDRPRLIVSRAVAAIELRDDAAIASTVSLCLVGNFDPRFLMTIAARLLGDQRSAEAWRILSVTDTPDKHVLCTLLKRLALTSDIKQLRLAANQRLQELNGGEPVNEPTDDEDIIVELPALPLPYAFLNSRVSNEDGGRGFKLSIINGGRVSPHHEGLYRKAMHAFAASIESRPPPYVVEYNDVFVNGAGQIWRPDGTAIRTKQTPLPDVTALAAVQSVDEAVLCTDSTRGIYHWYAERLPALAWRLAAGAPTPPILIGSHAARFQDETLRLLGVPPEQVIRIEDAVHCRRVLVSHVKLANILEWSRFKFIYERLAAAAALEQKSSIYPKRIYISRRDTDRRPLLNEAEIEDSLARLGVVPMLFSQMSLAAQICAIQQAEIVVGPHGAGLTHIIAHKPGLRVVELQPVQTGSHFLRMTMARLSRLRGHHHTLWLEPVNPITREWSADAAGFTATVESVLGERWI